MYQKIRKERGITLIALAITIIILLILATITIVELKNTKLFSKTIDAKNKYKQAAEKENNTLDDYANKINEIAGGTSKINNRKCETIAKIEKTDGTKKIEIACNKVTVVENGTTYTATIDINKDPSSTEKDSRGNWKNDYDANTKNVLSKIYGTAVEYTGNTDINAKTWRIFYIDFANKYGDGEGTIYLKADWKTNDTKLYEQASYAPSDTTKLKNMNQKWWAQRGTATWNANEHQAAWLCDSTQWTKYKNSSATYAIGGPSAEMYCDSYNSVDHLAGGDVTTNYKLGANYRETDYPGYIYTLNGTQSIISKNDYWTGNNTIDYTNYDSMYCGSNKAKGSYYWWLASPSAITSGNVCGVDGHDAFLNRNNINDTHGVCPLVSLPANTQLNIK